MDNFKLIEEKWQKYWAADASLWRAKDHSTHSINSRQASSGQVKPKLYILNEFPYPSGSGLHVGHAFSFIGGDVYARFKRMQGYNVLFPMGWDAFGLPTENYAIKMKRKPQEITKENTDMFRSQMKRLAFSFDWSREINTTDPTYYKWTQWIFIQLFKKGLAYKKEMPINWCPSCKIGLANEEVVDSKCERCGSEVSRRNISQWIVKITEYADKLIEGLKETNFIDKVKQAQINWIGKSEGARVRFKIDDLRFKNKTIEVFTTRPDTLFGATFMVIAPEHPLVSQLLETHHDASLQKDIEAYVKQSKKKSDLERTELLKEKTGVFSGLYAINPVNDKKIPIWISDFVLSTYGTGAIMSVPAHDERDFAFAMKFNLPIIPVIIKEYEVAKSYLVGSPKITDEELMSIGIRIVAQTESGNRKLEIPKENLEKYESLVIEKMDNGFWNEYLADDVVFIFKDKKGKIERFILNQETEKKINDLAIKFIGDNNWTKKPTVWSWLADEIFYTDYISTVNVGEGKMINSEPINGLKPAEAFEKMIKWIEEKGIGERTASYHLRDWIFSRQHYWGEPIPMINCPKCGWVPEEDKNLPVLLPEVEAYEPTDDSKSPLSKIDSFVKCNCPACGQDAQRETDTMPNWAGSDWYFLAYVMSEKLKQQTASANAPSYETTVTQSATASQCDIFSDSRKELEYWGPVDIYIGGDEHNVLHLLYSRFIYQFLWDLGVLPKEIKEPYYKRISHGVILGPDGQRMSKSKGNVIIPEVVADKYGVDVVRMYLMFMGPFDSTMAWNENTLMGVKRFLDRFNEFIKLKVSQVTGSIASSKEVKVIINKLIKGVTDDFESFKYNTAIAKMMEALNSLSSSSSYKVESEDIKTLIELIAPLAPYTAEELWALLHPVGVSEGYISIHLSKWPVADKKYLIEDTATIMIAINGKVRSQISVDSSQMSDKIFVLKLAKEDERIKKWLGDSRIVKEIYVEGKMVNLVLR